LFSIEPEKLDFHAEFNKFKSESGYKPVSRLTSSTEASKASSLDNLKDIQETLLKEIRKDKVESQSNDLPQHKPDQLKGVQQSSSPDSQDIPLSKSVNNSSKTDFHVPALAYESLDRFQASGIKSKDEGNKVALNDKPGKREHENVKQETKDAVDIVQENSVDQVRDNRQKDVEEPKEKVAIDDKNVAAVLLKKLEEHEENQKKFLEEQRQVLAELKEHHAQDIERQKPDDDNSKAKDSETAGEKIVQKALKLEDEIQKTANEDIAKLTKDVDLAEKKEERRFGEPINLKIQSADIHKEKLETLPKAKRDEPIAIDKKLEYKQASSLKPPVISNMRMDQSEIRRENILKDIPENKVGEDKKEVLTNNGNKNEVNSVQKENVDWQLKSEAIKPLNNLGDSNNAIIVDDTKVHTPNTKVDRKANQKVDRDI